MRIRSPEGGAVTVQLSKRRKEGETEVEMQANIAEPLDIPEVLKTICGILAQRRSNRTGAKA